RCVKGTIPRHERAVLIQAGGGGAALATKCTQHAGRSASTLKRAFARRRGLFSSDRASGSTLIFGCRQQAGVKKPKQLAARDTRTQGQAAMCAGKATAGRLAEIALRYLIANPKNAR